MWNLVHLTHIPFSVAANKIWIIILFFLQICFSYYSSDFTLVTYNNALHPAPRPPQKHLDRYWCRHRTQGLLVQIAEEQSPDWLTLHDILVFLWNNSKTHLSSSAAFAVKRLCDRWGNSSIPSWNPGPCFYAAAGPHAQVFTSQGLKFLRQRCTYTVWSQREIYTCIVTTGSCVRAPVM